jgi:large conductance mechanosensitive channel
MNLLSDFKQFLLRGNVVDLAVAVVIGAAFGAVITALVEDLLTPVIAVIFGEPNFAALDFTINDSLVVVPINSLIARSRKEPPVDPTTKKCSECLSEIPLDARRCAFCTIEVMAT